MVLVVPLVPVILARFKIQGHSMLPTLKPNQEMLISSLPYFFSEPKTGDLVAFRSEGLYIIKRIKYAKSGEYKVEGDNKEDSKDYGWINKKSIIGKVIYILS